MARLVLLLLALGCASQLRAANQAACDRPGEPERPYMNDPEYNHQGCTRSERMAKVHAFRDLDDGLGDSPGGGVNSRLVHEPMQ
jgi:hypothetical protein